MHKLRTQDARAAAMFLAVSLFFGGKAAMELEIGSLSQMGAGFFPLALCVILFALGAAILLKARPDEGASTPVNWRATLLVASAPVAFGLTVRSLGLLPALLISVALAVFASRKVAPWRALAIVLGVTAFCVVVFKFGMQVPFALVNTSLAH